MSKWKNQYAQYTAANIEYADGVLYGIAWKRGMLKRRVSNEYIGMSKG